MEISRAFNGLCYVLAGIAAFVISPSAGSGGATALFIVGGVGAIGYGFKIWLTRTGYWVNTLVYLLAVVAVVGAFTALR